MTKPMPLYDVFLSYSRSDEQAVTTLARRLEDEANLRIWLDQWRLVPGEPWPDAIDSALSASQTCAVFLGPEGIGPWENEELRAALRLRAEQKGFRVIPVLLPGANLPEMGKLPLFLSSLTWVDFRLGLDNPTAFRCLVAGIRGTEPGPIHKQPPTLQSLECPYRGLEVFEESHAKYFFGREAVTQQVIEALLHHRFIAVLGPSGSGKSSLVRAGVIPELRAGGLSGSENWEYITVTPGVHPLDELALSLAGLDRDSDQLEQTRRLLDHLRLDERALHLHIRLHLSGKPKNTFLFLFIDRFEEILTLCKDDDERDRFLLNLRYASTIGDGQIITVITMRADFLELAAAHRNLTEMLSGHQIFLSRMDDQDLRKAIEEPAGLVGLRFEKGLVERILDEVGHEPGALPLLEDALMQLYEHRSAENIALLRAYQELGGVHGALAKRAEEVFASFSADEQAIAQRVLLTLTEPGEDEDIADTRRRAEVNELWSGSADRPGVEKVIERLVAARLLTMSRDQREARVVEVAHEALIRGWPRLRQWIDDKRDALRLRSQIIRSAHQWRVHNRDAGFLYRGVRLAEALAWKNDNGALMNELEREFLETSAVVQSQESRAAQRRRWVTIGVSAMILVLAVLALFIYLRQQRTALVSKLVNDSKQATDPELGVWMALEAVRLSPTADAESALRQALTNLQDSVVLRGHEGNVYTAVFSPDGEKVVTASADKTAQIWDAHTGEPLLKEPLRHSEEVYSAEFSPDGKLVVTASMDKTAKLWDAQTGQLLATFNHEEEVNCAKFSPDGQYVATTSDDKAVKIWEVKTHNLRFGPLLGHEGKIYRAVFNFDGSRLLTASEDKTARLWDLTSGQPLFTLRLHTKGVIRIDFSPDGNYVITGSKDNTSQIWDARTGRPLFSKPLLQNIIDDKVPTVNGVAFSPGPGPLQAVTVSSDRSGRIWDVKTGTVVQTLQGHRDSIHSVAYSKDGEQIVTTSSDRTARLWTRNGEFVSELRGHSGKVWTADFSLDGKHVVTASWDHTARIWDTQIGKPLFNGVPSAGRHTDTINCVAYNPDGDEIVTASADHTARIWDAHTGQPSLKEPLRHNGEVYSASYSEDGKLVVTASADHTARIWDAHTGQPLKGPLLHDGEVYSAAFSPDGSQVVTTSGPSEAQSSQGKPEHTAQIWDVRTGNRVSVLRGHHAKIYAAAFSRDGKQVVTASADADAPVRIWDVQTGLPSPIVLNQSLDVYGIAFNRAGDRLVSANRDKTARVWDPHTGKLIYELGHHDDQVRSASFSPNGKQVVTASLDKTARIWDAYTGQLLLELRGHGDKVYSAAFSPDGKQVATAGVDKIVRIYACEECGTMEELIQLAHSRKLRQLKENEQMAYLHHK